MEDVDSDKGKGISIYLPVCFLSWRIDSYHYIETAPAAEDDNMPAKSSGSCSTQEEMAVGRQQGKCRSIA